MFSKRLFYSVVKCNDCAVKDKQEHRMQVLNPFPDCKIFDSSNLKQIADNILNCA